MSEGIVSRETDGFTLAGPVQALELNVPAPALVEKYQERKRHAYGSGPFARLRMPLLPSLPGVYLWALDGEIVYCGKADRSLMHRLGNGGYSKITLYNTFASGNGRRGGQQTNCRVNMLANVALASGSDLVVYYRVSELGMARRDERQWMEAFGKPRWNRAD